MPECHYLPSHLCIDEFKSVKNASDVMSFIFVNIVNHEVIDIVEGRRQHYLSDYFMRYSLNARLRVKTVTMDMYSPYIGLIKACFPKTDIIIDCFHIVQYLNRALDHVRIQAMNNLRYVRPRDHQKLKEQWGLVLKNKADLNFHDFSTHRLYTDMTSKYVVANYLVELNPQLRDTYQLVNQLKGTLRTRRFSLFESLLRASKKHTYPCKMRTILQTLEKYVDLVQNTLKYTLSNDPIEGINNKVKDIERSGYGYRNFYHLGSQVLISFTLTREAITEKPLYFREDAAH